MVLQDFTFSTKWSDWLAANKLIGHRERERAESGSQQASGWRRGMWVVCIFSQTFIRLHCTLCHRHPALQSTIHTAWPRIRVFCEWDVARTIQCVVSPLWNELVRRGAASSRPTGRFSSSSIQYMDAKCHNTLCGWCLVGCIFISEVWWRVWGPCFGLEVLHGLGLECTEINAINSFF